MAKILLVDDDRDLVDFLQACLEARGHEIVSCMDGGMAFQNILIDQYDLIIMDYFMPGLNGNTVCSSVRETEKVKDLPILVITAFSDRGKEFFTDRGATDVLFKPFSKEELFAALTPLLNQRPPSSGQSS